MSGSVFIDSNVWIYAFGESTGQRERKAKTLIESEFEHIVVSPQVLGEVYNVLTKKLSIEKQNAYRYISRLILSFPVICYDGTLVKKAIELHIRYSFSYWDSVIIASALLNDCVTLYSEDLSNGMVIEDALRIHNPFA